MSIRKKQFKLYLDEGVLERLEGVAEKMGRRNPQEVIEDLIRFYLPVLSNVHDTFNRAMQYQMSTETELFASKQSQKASPYEVREDIPPVFDEADPKQIPNIPRLVKEQDEKSHGLKPNIIEEIKKKRPGK